MANLIVAETILAQLGGSRFKVMTGARDFVGGKDFLLFRVPRARGGINKIMIILDSNDTYTAKFIKCNFRKDCHEVIAKREGLHDNQLQPVFTEVTGLDTHL